MKKVTGAKSNIGFGSFILLKGSELRLPKNIYLVGCEIN